MGNMLKLNFQIYVSFTCYQKCLANISPIYTRYVLFLVFIL